MVIKNKLLLLLIGSVPSYGITVHPMKELQRIEVTISKDCINRISVLGDKIQHVFGDEGRYSIEQDEENGQIFLKVIGDSNDIISLSIVTEGGRTQDLILKPQKGLSDPIIIKSESSDLKSIKKLQKPSYYVPFQNEHSSYEMELCVALKNLVKGKLQDIFFDGTISRADKEGLEIVFEKAVSTDPYICLIYKIFNATNDCMTLETNNFYQKGDRALALSTHFLKKDESCYLYVIQKLGRTDV